MRFGICSLDDMRVVGKTVLCRVDINQPVDRQTGALKSTARIESCVPTVAELSEKGAKVVLLAHQGSDIELKNFYTTAPHAQILQELLGRKVNFIDDVCGPAARRAISALKDGEILLLDNVRFCAEEQTLFELKLKLSHKEQADTEVVRKLAPLAETDGYTVIGGDSVTATRKYGVESKMGYICTGGGALIRFLTGEELPVVRALRHAAEAFAPDKNGNAR